MEERLHPDSSMIEEYAYDDEMQILEVTFCKGGTYSYPGVPEHVFQSMKDADSVGRFFLQNIKGSY
ncbi:MAG: hypothetical protein A2Y38_19970 [Spirochaetes bacterium GWB1_59_5]|nr:MAG: hypothetical protein A2Y38_19970 [Spirochaetes bacterium GWB1_59_5]